MGHIAAKKEFFDLQKRLDKMAIGAPARKRFFQILEELYTPEECRVAAAIPMKIAPVETIARTARMEPRRVQEVLDVLIGKGLVIDIHRPDGKIFYFLNPTVIGFFEFTMMRVRDAIDQKKVARLMWEYIHEEPDKAFLKMLSDGPTFIARPVVHETALEPEVFTEVLDWEKASAIVETADMWAEGLCHCRHVKFHIDEPCEKPLDMCMSFGRGAEYLVRAGISKEISKERAMDILVQARELSLVQMCDNVKNSPTFICNCCKCCCEMMHGLRTIPHPGKVVSSNYVARIDSEACNGCGNCAKACPVDVIELVPAEPSDKAKKRKKRALVNEEFCLGCGVCHAQCKFDALKLEPIGERVYTPETMMEKMMMQSLERGKLQHLLFSDPDRVSHRVLSAFFGALLNLPPAKQYLARQQVKSKFVHFLLDQFSKTKGGWVTKG